MDSTRIMGEVTSEYTSAADDYGFTKTKVPVKLLKYEGEELVSRSQAKRLIMRVDKFKEVILDFEGIKKIGQPFADEIFRVFKNNNPKLRLMRVNTNEETEKVIKYILNNK
jgi:hypothetical protein